MVTKVFMLIVVCWFPTDFKRAPIKLDWRNLPPNLQIFQNGRVSVWKSGDRGLVRFKRNGEWRVVKRIEFNSNASKVEVHILGYNEIMNRYFEWEEGEDKPKEGSKIIMIREHLTVPYVHESERGPVILGTIQLKLVRYALVHPDQSQVKTAESIEQGPITWRNDKPKRAGK